MVNIFIFGFISGKTADVQELHISLMQLCDQRGELLKTYDTTGFIPKILLHQQQIQQLEAQHGLPDLRARQSMLLANICSQQPTSQGCQLVQQFNAYNQKRESMCTTARCQIMRLYQKLNGLTVAFAQQLQPYPRELQELDAQVYSLKQKICDLTGKETTLTPSVNTLFL